MIKKFAAILENRHSSSAAPTRATQLLTPYSSPPTGDTCSAGSFVLASCLADNGMFAAWVLLAEVSNEMSAGFAPWTMVADQDNGLS